MDGTCVHIQIQERRSHPLSPVSSLVEHAHVHHFFLNRAISSSVVRRSSADVFLLSRSSSLIPGVTGSHSARSSNGRNRPTMRPEGSHSARVREDPLISRRVRV